MIGRCNTQLVYLFGGGGGGGFRKNRTLGFKWCFSYTLVIDLKPEVRTFVRFGEGRRFQVKLIFERKSRNFLCVSPRAPFFFLYFFLFRSLLRLTSFFLLHVKLILFVSLSFCELLRWP